MKHNTLKLLNDAVFETLEDRRLMSSVPITPWVLSNGVLNVTDSQTTNTRVMIDLADNNTMLTVDVMGQRTAFPVKQVNQLKVSTLNGNNYVYINPHIDIPSQITLGNGYDTVRGGGGDNTIIAGNGNDLLQAEGTNNVIQAGSGSDVIKGHAGNNTITAGDGNDYIISLGQADHLTAGDGNDTFAAGDGHDVITHGTGKDVMTGGAGNSYVAAKTTRGTGTTGTTGKTSSGGSSSSGTSSGGTSSGGSSSAGTTSGGSTTKSSSGSSTSTTGTTSTTGSSSSSSGGTNTSITTSNTGNDQAPVAVINTLAGPRFTGMGVNVDGLQSSVGTGTCITTNYAWDFGDPNSQYNQLTGFNASHVYDRPGTYTITLTVTNDAGLASTSTQQMTIAASTRNQIYVDSVNGSDTNPGTANAPLQSLTAAFADLGDNTEILLRAGETFDTDDSLHINNTNVLIGRYGTGANPTIMRNFGTGSSTIATYGDTNGLTIQDITFDTPYAAAAGDANHKIGLSGIYVGGQNVVVRDCTFLNLDDAINENGNPTGVLVQGNSAPLMTGLRGYFVWGQGEDDTVVGNYVANTNVEHVMRCVDVDELNVQDNNFTNHDGKGCIEVHRGEYDWIVGNTVTDGDIRVGPLGLWGESPSSNTSYCVIEDNNLTDTMLYVQAGTHHATIANNVVTNDGGQAYVINGEDSQGRTSQDITLINNTAVDTGTQGNFIEVLGWVSGIVMENNLWVAPKLQVGSYGSAPVYVNATDLSCFTEISDNIWPDPVGTSQFAGAGINFVGTSMQSANYLSPAQWNAQSNVGNDVFENVSLDGAYDVSLGSLQVGAGMQMAA